MTFPVIADTLERMPGNTFHDALKLHQQGRITEAEEIYRRVLQHQPDHPDTLHLLGVVRQPGPDPDRRGGRRDRQRLRHGPRGGLVRPTRSGHLGLRHGGRLDRAVSVPLSVSTGGCGFFGVVDFASPQVDTIVAVGSGFTIVLRSPQPGNVTMQLCAQVDGRLMQRLPRGGRPQVELVARGATAEAAVGVPRQVRGERAASAALPGVQRARAVHLVAAAAHGHKVQQFQNGLKANVSA